MKFNRFPRLFWEIYDLSGKILRLLNRFKSLGDKVSPYRYKGKRSWSLPLEMLSHFSPFAPFFEIKGISPSAEGDQRTPPFGNPPPLKRWTKLLLLCLLCAARLLAFKCNVFFFRHHEPINHKSRNDPEGCSAEHICRKMNGKIQS